MNKFEYKNLTPFKWFVLENFPFIEADFDALTEWQLFCKLGKEMNKIINSENTLGTQMENVTNAFIELQNYVTNYFDNLDVQDEINNKLNQMAKDGTLTNLIGNYIQPLIDTQNKRLDLQDNKIKSIENSVIATNNGTPLVVDSIEKMTDIEKIYLLTTDNNWYYYKDNNWVRGGLYNSQGIANNSITYNLINDELINSFLLKNNELINKTQYFELGNITITENGWNYSNSNSRVRTKSGTSLYLKANSKIILPENVQCFLGWYNGLDYKTRSWFSNHFYTPEDGEYVILLRLNPEIEIDDVNIFLNNFKIIKSDVTNYDNKILNIENNFDINYLTSFEYGTISKNGYASSKSRLRNPAYFNFNDSILHCLVDEGYSYAIGTYTSQNYSSLISKSDWSNIKEYPLQKNLYYTIELRKNDNSEITNLEEFLQHFKFYATTKNKKINNTIKYNSQLCYHRGYSALRPENTIPSYEYAKSIGGKYVETDIQQTSDGHFVLMHDLTVDRTTNGSGNVKDLTLSQIKELYITNSFYSNHYNNSLRVPTLEEFLHFCKFNNLTPILETKGTINIDNFYKILKDNEFLNNCIIMSFNYETLQNLRYKDKNIKLCYLSTNLSQTVFHDLILLGENSGFGSSLSSLNYYENNIKTTVDILHNLYNCFVLVFVIDNYDDLQICNDNNIDLIVTNRLLNNNNNINYPIINLDYQSQLSTYSKTFNGDIRLHEDVLQLIAQIYVPKNERCIISIGDMQKTIDGDNEFHMINLQFIPIASNYFDLTITGNNLFISNLSLKRYVKFVTQY